MTSFVRHHRKIPCEVQSLRLARACAGFSLVEIMVGMVIGLLGMVVMMQMFSVFEGQKRATTGGSEAQNSGAIALFGLQRDIEKSGYGFSAYKMIGCNMTLPAANAAVANVRPAVTISPLAPVTINHAAIPAGDANTDTLLISYGNANSPLEGNGITAQPSQPNYAVQTPASFILNDRVVAEAQARPAPCTLIMDRVVGVGAPNVTVVTGVAGMTNGTLYNVGQAPKLTAYAIRNSNLTVCEYISIDPVTQVDSGKDCGNAALVNNTTVWVPIASNIVSLRAQYGHDTLTPLATPANQTSYFVDTYNQTTPVTACGWVRASAVRLALVVGNDQYNKAVVTANVPAWAGSATTPIDLSSVTNTFAADGAVSSWQNYRYKVFETVAPMRNVTWQGVQAGC